MKKTIIFLLLLSGVIFQVNAQIFSANNGTINLKGVAPKETITATSASLQGRLDPASKKFGFRQSLNNFSFSQGEMQKKDAEEMYWETDKFPYVGFKGQIINDVDLTKPGIYKVTAQGTFDMHGVQKVIKIPATVKVTANGISINAKFEVYLSDYNIKVPRLVVLKVSEKFEANISIAMNKTKV